MPDEIIDIDDNTTFNASYCDDESELCIITTNKPECNITMKWYNKLNSTCKEMFKGLTNIIEVDLSKMRISLYDMSNLFKDCSSLTKINLTKVDTTNSTNFSNMFANCVSLSSLNLSSFRTSNVASMENMFYNCSSLESLNLSNFDTSKVKNFKDMFCHCDNLTSLYLSNINFSKISEKDFLFDSLISLMFGNCSNLNHLNSQNYNNQGRTVDQLIKYKNEDKTKNIAICIDDNKYVLTIENNNDLDCTLHDCSDYYFQNQRRLNNSEENYHMTKNYPYEYKNICHEKFPLNTAPDGNNTDKKEKEFSTDIITDSSGEIMESNTNKEEIPSTDIITYSSVEIIEGNTTKEKIFQTEIITDLKEEIREQTTNNLQEQQTER